MKGLDSKVVMITGANSGIGEAAALAFAKAGAKIGLCARRSEKGEEVAEKVIQLGGEAIFVKTDVTNEDDVSNAVKKTVDKYGELNMAFNNAGIGGDLAQIDQDNIENWNNVINTNLTGVWLSMKYEIIQMLKNGGGSIVNTSSVNGVVGNSMGLAPYIASKHGVIGLTKAAALEYAQKKIRVNAVCPGYILTPMTTNEEVPEEVREHLATLHPLGRMGRPEEIVEAVLWLCSSAASFVTGHSMMIDGGFTAQ